MLAALAWSHALAGCGSEDGTGSPPEDGGRDGERVEASPAVDASDARDASAANDSTAPSKDATTSSDGQAVLDSAPPDEGDSKAPDSSAIDAAAPDASGDESDAVAAASDAATHAPDADLPEDASVDATVSDSAPDTVDAHVPADASSTAVDASDSDSSVPDASDGGAAADAGGPSQTVFTGATGSSWVTLAATPAWMYRGGFTDFTPAGYASFYSGGQSASFGRYDFVGDTWTQLATPQYAVNGSSYVGMAWVGGKIFGFDSNQIVAFDVAAGTWSAPLQAVTNVTLFSQHTHDDAGKVYAVGNVGSATSVVVYDVAANTVTQKAATFSSPQEPRIAWDSTSRLLYVAPYFAGGTFYSYDPSTSTTTALPSIPDGSVSTAFCADRSGHIYAAGNWQYNQMWQYTIATTTWAQVAKPPFYNQMTAACTVSDSGWLYFSDGQGSLAKLQLL